MKKIDKTQLTEEQKQEIRDKVQGKTKMDIHIENHLSEQVKEQVQFDGDKLDVLFQMQKALDVDIILKHPDKTNKTLSEWVMGITIAMESEIDEIRREVNWKWWKGEKEINDTALKSEIIDMWHFLISMSMKAGMTADDVLAIYKEKNAENFARQVGQSSEGQAYDYRGGNQ
jgi:hypothetical protein